MGRGVRVPEHQHLGLDDPTEPIPTAHRQPTSPLTPTPPRTRTGPLGPAGPLVLVAVVLALLVGAWCLPSLMATTMHAKQPTVLSRSEDAALPAGAELARISPALVNINTTVLSGQGAGTGIVLTPTGQILTNNHVIEGATSIDAVDIGNGHRYVADVVGYDRTHDVAVLQLRGASGLTTATLGSSAALRIGDMVTAVGNAGGQGGPPATAPGMVTALDQPITAADESGGAEQLAGLFELRANIQPGDSGGAVVDRRGAVVGMTTAAARGRGVQQAGGDGFAIPIDQARTIATQITGTGGGPTIHRGPTAALGIEVSQASADDAISGTTRGVPVNSVDPGSSPAVAGLQAGDIITSLDGRPVASHTALTDRLAPHRPGDRVQLGWNDAFDTPHQGVVRLVAGPPA